MKIGTLGTKILKTLAMSAFGVIIGGIGFALMPGNDKISTFIGGVGFMLTVLGIALVVMPCVFGFVNVMCDIWDE